MTARIRPGAAVRWCMLPRHATAEAIVLQGEVRTVPYTPGTALVTVRDVEARQWVERDVVLLVGDLVAVGGGQAEVVPLGTPVPGTGFWLEPDDGGRAA